MSDYWMPNMNGLDLLVETRKRGIDSPFILLTGENSAVITCLALGHSKIGCCDYHESNHPQFYESLGIGFRNQRNALNFIDVDYYLHKNGNNHDLFNELLHFVSAIFATRQIR
ncbi:MAG: hypothetical protein ACFFD4_36105 [Candidatus Odinarchaeota archaeon]